MQWLESCYQSTASHHTSSSDGAGLELRLKLIEKSLSALVQQQRVTVYDVRSPVPSNEEDPRDDEKEVDIVPERVPIVKEQIVPMPVVDDVSCPVVRRPERSFNVRSHQQRQEVAVSAQASKLVPTMQEETVLDVRKVEQANRPAKLLSATEDVGPDVKEAVQTWAGLDAAETALGMATMANPPPFVGPDRKEAELETAPGCIPADSNVVESTAVMDCIPHRATPLLLQNAYLALILVTNSCVCSRMTDSLSGTIPSCQMSRAIHSRTSTGKRQCEQ